MPSLFKEGIKKGIPSNRIREWYWNYNGLFTPYTEDLLDCNLNGMAFDDAKGEFTEDASTLLFVVGF